MYYAPYTPPSYENQAYADGKPFNVYANISTEGNYVSKSKWSHAYSLGINYRYGDNFGKGRYGTAGKNETMLSVGDSRSGMRDYNYRDNVLATTQYALYIQDNITKMFANKHILRANIGLRYDIQNSAATFTKDEYILSGGQIYNKRWVGLTSKAPSLNQLYTDPDILTYY